VTGCQKENGHQTPQDHWIFLPSSEPGKRSMSNYTPEVETI
jgi:hypothetical protein